MVYKLFKILWMVPSIIFSEYLTLSIPLLDISKNFHNSYHYPFLIFNFIFSFQVHEYSGKPLISRPVPNYFSLIEFPTVKNFPFSYFLFSQFIEITSKRSRRRMMWRFIFSELFFSLQVKKVKVLRIPRYKWCIQAQDCNWDLDTWARTVAISRHDPLK